MLDMMAALFILRMNKRTKRYKIVMSTNDKTIGRPITLNLTSLMLTDRSARLG